MVVSEIQRRGVLSESDVAFLIGLGLTPPPARSDADFLVEFEPGGALSPLDQFFGLAAALERLLGRKVDLVEPGAVRNPYVLAGINRAREVVYAA